MADCGAQIPHVQGRRRGYRDDVSVPRQGRGAASEKARLDVVTPIKGEVGVWLKMAVVRRDEALDQAAAALLHPHVALLLAGVHAGQCRGTSRIRANHAAQAAQVRGTSTT